MNTTEQLVQHREPWNKDKLVGQKAPLRLRDMCAIRVRLQLAHKTRDLALFNLATDSKLRACDLVKLRVHDVGQGERIATRAIILQQKTQRPVQFAITTSTRESTAAWIKHAQLRSDSYLFPSRLHASEHLSIRQYARIVEEWISEIGLNVSASGTHTMRRPKATLSNRRSRNLRAAQLLLGHTKLKVRCGTSALKWRMLSRSPNRPRSDCNRNRVAMRSRRYPARGLNRLIDPSAR
jgi:site-specific recombinase XerC